MSYCDEDFYAEPSEFDQQVETFKESLLKSVKEEYKAEMDRLRKENAELQAVKRDFESIKSQYQQKERKLEHAKNNMLREVRNERLSTLMEDFKVAMYRVSATWVKPEKCNKCDENRLIHYKTPLGNDENERCTCSRSQIVYVPKEFICVRFRLDDRKDKLTVWYNIPTNDDEDKNVRYSFDSQLKVIYADGMDFEKLEKHETFFHTVEECQAYCDWLNAKEGTE
ncbi:hypothetical protein M5X00_13865 [Paenibacillus alvei]|uniref:hypothetical protein n=1 Tax=Paenibacillus alvei TaxID=44250 RepID=UPI00227DED1E|nr:hypothetical protein [Paenibacillus alvei]MCY9755329.1 hypothetical protein [Paenibacillus alvei]